MVAVVHQSLKQRALLPSEHLVDKGYTDSHVLARISHKLQAKSNWCRNVIVLPANLPAADRVAA